MPPGPTTLLSGLTYGGPKTLSKNCYHGNFSLWSISQAMLQVLENSWSLVSASFSWVLESVASTQRTFKPRLQGFWTQVSSTMQVNDTGHRWGAGCYRGLRPHLACKLHATVLSMQLIRSTEGPEQLSAAPKGVSWPSSLHWELPFSSKLGSGQGHNKSSLQAGQEPSSHWSPALGSATETSQPREPTPFNWALWAWAASSSIFPWGRHHLPSAIQTAWIW